MRILRLQTHALSASGDVTIAGVALTQSQATVATLRLAAGETFGGHPAAAHQVLAVLSGTAVVAGADEVKAEIGPDEAAVWDADEPHQTRAVTDLLAVIVESEAPPQTAGTPRT